MSPRCFARSSTASVPATCKPLRAAIRRALRSSKRISRASIVCANERAAASPASNRGSVGSMMTASTTVSHDAWARSGSVGGFFAWYSSSTMRGVQTSPYKSGRRSRSPTPASVISGVVLVTTGGLSVTGLFLEVYFVIEQRDIVLAQQIEKLTPREVQELRSLT